MPRPRGATPAQEFYRRLKPGPGHSADDVQLDQRQRIYRAMIEIVADGGFEAVTVRKLTRLAGVSTSAFYAQFDGKDECFVATYEMVMDEARRHVASTRSGLRDRKGQLRRSFRALARGLGADANAACLALVEAFGGGPAALDRIRSQETGLEIEVKECLDRRGSRVSASTVSWINAGFLRIARTAALSGEGRGLDNSIERLLRWALPSIDERAPDLSQPEQPESPASAEPPLRGPAVLLVESTDPASEREIILAAVRRLARAEGYWGLSIARIRSAAGVSRAGFNRHFDDVEHCYLTAVGDLAGSYMRALTTAIGPGRDWAAGVHRGVVELCEAVAADPGTAKLAFSDVLTPGVGGMKCREALTSELAEAWRLAIPSTHRPDPITAEATAAALWSAVDHELEHSCGARLPDEADTYTFFLLAPLIGVDTATATVEQDSVLTPP